MKSSIKWLVGALSFIGIFWNEPITRRYTITADQWKNVKPIRLLHLSDLHSTCYGRGQKRLVRRIVALNPDVVVMTGDMFDDNRSPRGMFLLIKALKGKYPIYYVTGNHEQRWEEVKANMLRLQALGVQILNGKSRRLCIQHKRIRFFGISDPEPWKEEKRHEPIMYSLDKLMDAPDGLQERFEYNVLLSHRPEYFKLYQEYPFDLVLSGHAHGGQVRIPYLLNGLFSPGQGIFPPLAGGVYQTETQTLIVSRGLSRMFPYFRAFNPPEVVAIDIIGKNDV